jgi:hypothetical protein
MRLALNPNSLEDYQLFLRIKSLPQYRFQGRTAIVPDEYAKRLQRQAATPQRVRYTPHAELFDYQAAIAKLAIRKRKFCVFADCGLGKTLIFLEFARHAAKALKRGERVLIVSPLMVIKQTLAETKRFYGDTLHVERVRSDGLQAWLDSGEHRIGITNYEAFSKPIDGAALGGLILDESSMLKSHYGKWGQECLRLGRGLDWKMACTGTPAPNDRIEYANHAVFMDAFPTVNSFLAKFFVNRGQTGERWEMKPHAVKPFYRALSHWSIFLTNPAVYGWADNTEPLPPIHVHQHHVDLTHEQQLLAYQRTGSLFHDRIGGITSRSVLSQIAKGYYRGAAVSTNKPGFIRTLVESWPGESTIIWCLYNAEQKRLEAEFPEAASITGATPYELREALIDDFKSGRRKLMITKPKILGFGLNLHIVTRQVFSGLQDSYESYYQAVKRSNRYGATAPLNVHIPVTDIEGPMIQTVLDKAKRVQQDTEEQEKLFRECSIA